MIPEDYKGVMASDVYVAGALAACLTKDRQGAVTFSYVPGYRGRPVAMDGSAVRGAQRELRFRRYELEE